MEEKKQERARITEYGAGVAKFTGVTIEEVAMLQASALGAAWVRVNPDTGRVEKRSAFEPLPQPIDKNMEPFWRRQQHLQLHLELNDIEPLSNWSCPHVAIQHLCGYNYTPENYKEEAVRLEQWGFRCLRSQRGDTGHFIEVWYLPGLWCAKGELKDVVEKAGNNAPDQIEQVKNFLCRNASFGTLDISVQKAAMVID